MQKQWSFQDGFGKFHNIGFYHGQDSGYFMLFINDRITIVDYHIKNDKSYSFMIGNRLFQLSIELSNENFLYDLSDTTPQPEYHDWEKWRDIIAAALMIASLIYVLGTVGFQLIKSTFL